MTVDCDITVAAAYLLYIDAAKKVKDDALTANELKSFRIYLAMVLLSSSWLWQNSEKRMKAAKIRKELKSMKLGNPDALSAFMKALRDRLGYDKEDAD